MLHQLLRVGGALQKQLDNGRQQLQLHLRTSEVGYLTVVGYFSCLTVVGYFSRLTVVGYFSHLTVVGYFSCLTVVGCLILMG